MSNLNLTFFLAVLPCFVRAIFHFVKQKKYVVYVSICRVKGHCSKKVENFEEKTYYQVKKRRKSPRKVHLCQAS